MTISLTRHSSAIANPATCACQFVFHGYYSWLSVSLGQEYFPPDTKALSRPAVTTRICDVGLFGNKSRRVGDRDPTFEPTTSGLVTSLTVEFGLLALAFPSPDSGGISRTDDISRLDK